MGSTGLQDGDLPPQHQVASEGDSPRLFKNQVMSEGEGAQVKEGQVETTQAEAAQVEATLVETDCWKSFGSEFEHSWSLVGFFLDIGHTFSCSFICC
jgi:hypothetical protein